MKSLLSVGRVLCLLAWVNLARAQDVGGSQESVDAGTPDAAVPSSGAVSTYLPNEPATPAVPSVAPIPLGGCVGGLCLLEPSLSDLARATPSTVPQLMHREQTPRRERFVNTTAWFGAVSAGVVLGGAIAIAATDDVSSGRITRGVWLGYVTVSAPIVALSVWLARRDGSYEGYRSVRSLAWVAYALAVSDGAYLWSDAFQHNSSSKLLTVGAGVFGALALLPHALEAMNAARGFRLKRVNQRLKATASGFALTF